MRVVGLMPITTLNRTRVFIPILSILLASMVATLPIIASTPILPPLGLLMLLGWRLLRSDIFPAWIGLPLGLWDDILSGQPMGSAIFLWTAAMLFVDFLDTKLIWRDQWFDWVVASLILGVAILVGASFAQLGIPKPPLLEMLLPQWISGVLLFPMIIRIVAKLDSWRRAS